MSTVAFGRKSGTGMFHRLAKSGVAVCIIAWALAAPVRAATKVAVIDFSPGSGSSGQSWCNLLADNGYDCTLFPAAGPTVALDSFQVVIDLSENWTDPTGSLADFMRAGKGVILHHGAPGALGIETDPVVQAWVGATYLALGNGVLLTTASDTILGSTPPGTIIGGCGDGPCLGLWGESGFPNVKVLARWEFGTSSVGIMRNTWEGGKSVYFPLGFDMSDSFAREVLLRTMEVFSRPIPAISTWGLVCGALLLLVFGTVVIHGRYLGHTNRNTSAQTATVPLALTLLVIVCPHPGSIAIAQQENAIVIRTTDQTTELFINGFEEPPFHATDRPVVNARAVGVPGSSVLLLLWDEVTPDGKTLAYYGISPDGLVVTAVTETSYPLNLRYAKFDPSNSAPPVDASLAAGPDNDVYLVQFVTQPLPEFRTALENLGVVVRGFLPNHAYVATVPAGTRDQVAGLPFVRWVGPFHSAYRLEEEVLAEVTASAGPVKYRNYSIMLWDRGEAAQQTVAERIAQLGGCVRRLAPEERHLDATLTLEQVREVAKLAGVAFIDVPGEIGLDVDNARDVSGANHIDPIPGFRGQGVCGEVMDLGLQTTPLHDDFRNRPPILHGPNDATDKVHGTRVYGLVFGDGTCHTNGRGILPSAQGIFASWYPTMANEPPGGDCGTPQRGERYAHTAQLLGDPYYAVFQSNSWGHLPKTGTQSFRPSLTILLFRWI